MYSTFKRPIKNWRSKSSVCDNPSYNKKLEIICIYLLLFSHGVFHFDFMKFTEKLQKCKKPSEYETNALNNFITDQLGFRIFGLLKINRYRTLCIILKPWFTKSFDDELILGQFKNLFFLLILTSSPYWFKTYY